MSTKTPASTRDLSLDFVRGCAIILMIFAHVVGIVYGGETEAFHFFGRLGGQICFTLFLFVFAAVFGLKFAKGKFNTQVELKRSTKFLVAYYLVAIWIYIFFFGGYRDNPALFAATVWKIISFIWLPNYIEFISAFVFYAWLLIAFRKKISQWLQHPWIIGISTVFLYGLGRALYTIDLQSPYLNTIKGIFIGHSDVHYFPVISYLPVLVLGLLWGYYIVGKKVSPLKPAITATVVAAVVDQIVRLSPYNDAFRWPPTPAFLTYSLIFVFGGIVLFELVKKAPYGLKPIIFVGQSAFEYFIYHTIILTTTPFLFGGTRQNEYFSLLIFVFTILVITIFVYIKKALNKGVHTHF